MRILAFLFLFLVFGESSFGCRCRPNRNLETLVFQAKNIFIGRVAEIREASVVFEVVNVLKGGANKKIEIFNESGSCDFFSGISDSAIGQSYLVFARKLDKELLSQKCWGSETFDSNSIKFRKLSEVSNALSEIQELKRGVPRSWVENKPATHCKRQTQFNSIRSGALQNEGSIPRRNNSLGV